MPRSSPSSALRESTKMPDISRKVTACAACRKLKIKCYMTDSKPPCSRCKTRGLACTLNRSLQMILESDATWKDTIESRLGLLEGSLFNSQKQSNASASKSSHSSADSPSMVAALGPKAPAGTLAHQLPENKADFSFDLGAFPAASIRQHKRDNEPLAYRPDLISCGVLPIESAQHYFSFYKQCLDPIIHHVLTPEEMIDAVRARSVLLITAICAVSSFCLGAADHGKCLDALTREVSRKLFAPAYQFDDVRALCIGAFWLRELSAPLNGMAVRIATQLDLHRCITKMPHTKEACYIRTRLYFMVYLSDHHASLINGRPPMTQEWRAQKTPCAFLHSRFANGLADLSLISQVEFWSLCRRAFEAFGADVESHIVNERFAVMSELSVAFDSWHAEWQNAFAMNGRIGENVQAIFEMYYHSGKLFLFSHAFRGRRSLRSELSERARADEFQRNALQHALATVRCVSLHQALSKQLHALPSFFITMLAFSAACLLRMRQDAFLSGPKAPETHDLADLATALNAAMPANSELGGLLSSFAQSVEKALGDCAKADHDQIPRTADAEDYALNELGFDFFLNDTLSWTFAGNLDGSWMEHSCPEPL